MNRHAPSIDARTVDIRPGNTEVSQEGDYSQEKKKPLRARFIYGIIFLIMNLKAWFFRDYGQKVLAQFNYIKTCGVEGQDCCHTLGVLRVSLGCFLSGRNFLSFMIFGLSVQSPDLEGAEHNMLVMAKIKIFFSIMFVTTTKTRKLYEVRSTWHSGWWTLKFSLLIGSMAVPFFVPSKYIQLYGELARIGAGIFLVLQLVSVIEFITWWNNYWMPDKEMKESCSLGLVTSTILYIASVCGIVVMYFMYGRSLKCSLNIFFITWTAILLIVMMAVSLHSKVNRGLLSSGTMASYIVFLCWSALRSEPVSEKCNKKSQADENSDWTTILSFLIAICAIVMATFSTGIDSQSFQFRKDKVQQEDDIPYDYGFFHMVFALGAMYFAMLFISWNLNHSARKWSIDVGWASTWVKIVNEWFAAAIYLVREPKVMDVEGLNAADR